MRGKRSYGKSMGSLRRSFPKIKAKLKEADGKLKTVHTTILQENEALKDPEFDIGSDLVTEADRLKSARKDIDEALRLIEWGKVKTLGELRASRGREFSPNDFPYEGIKDELSGVAKDRVKKLDPTFSGTYLALTDVGPSGDGTTQEIWMYKNDKSLDEVPASTRVYQVR